MDVDPPPPAIPGLGALHPRHLKREHSENAEYGEPKRRFFGEGAYGDIVYLVAERFTNLMLTCMDTRPASWGYEFAGRDRYGNSTSSMWLGLTAKLVEADVYGPAYGAAAPRERRFRVGFRIWDAFGPVPIWEELGRRQPPLPLEVYVPCGRNKNQTALMQTLIAVLDPWLSFVHDVYGLTALPRNTDIGDGK